MAGQVWNTSALGGYMYSDELSTVMRVVSQPVQRFRNLCDAEDGSQKGLHAGDTFSWNAYENIGSQGGRLSETQAIPESNFRIRQRTMTIYEFGNSIPYTGLLDDLSKQPLTDVITRLLRDDVAKAYDNEAYAAMSATVVKVRSSSASAIVVNTAGTLSTGTHKMTKAHVQLISDQMKEANVPAYDGANYMVVSRPSNLRTFKNELEQINQYTESGFGEIERGEIGRYESCRFVEQTHQASKGYSSMGDEAFFLGADTVTEALVIPEEIRGKIPGDYGRSRGVAWYGLGGFGLVHPDSLDPRVWHWASDS